MLTYADWLSSNNPCRADSANVQAWHPRQRDPGRDSYRGRYSDRQRDCIQSEPLHSKINSYPTMVVLVIRNTWSHSRHETTWWIYISSNIISLLMWFTTTASRKIGSFLWYMEENLSILEAIYSRGFNLVSRYACPRDWNITMSIVDTFKNRLILLLSVPLLV